MDKNTQSKIKLVVVSFSKPASKITGGGGGNIPEYYMFPGSGGFGRAPAMKNFYG